MKKALQVAHQTATSLKRPAGPQPKSAAAPKPPNAIYSRPSTPPVSRGPTPPPPGAMGGPGNRGITPPLPSSAGRQNGNPDGDSLSRALLERGCFDLIDMLGMHSASLAAYGTSQMSEWARCVCSRYGAQWDTASGCDGQQASQEQEQRAALKIGRQGESRGGPIGSRQNAAVATEGPAAACRHFGGQAQCCSLSAGPAL